MLTYQTPGVYYEVMDASTPSITGIRTDVAGLVGIAERGPVDVPLPIESWRQFQAHYGDFTGSGFLAYAVRGFFENGGRRCWVVRVASRRPRGGVAAATAVVRRQLPAPPHGPDVWRILASSPGSWGNELSVRLTETHRFQTTGDLLTSHPDYTRVAGTSGFARGTLVRLSQPPTPPVFRVVSDVDSAERRLYWRLDRPELRLPYDGALTGFDPAQPLQVESVEYTLAVSHAGLPVALYEDLSLIPEHPRYGPVVLALEVEVGDFEAERTLPAAPQPVAIEELRPAFLDPRPFSQQITADDVPTGSTHALTGGADGLALLEVTDFTGEEAGAEESDEAKARKRRGLRALGEVSEVAIVAVPDIHIQPVPPPDHVPVPRCVPDPCLPPPRVLLPAEPTPHPYPELPPVFSEADVYRVQSDLIQHCEEKRDRVALLEAPIAVVRNAALGLAGVRAWRSRFDSKFAAFYHPWLRVVDPLRSPGRLTRDIPCSGHVAGQFARTDLTVGVHKAPANAPLGWVQDATSDIGHAEHGILNEQGINAIRALPGRGLRILGARTVSSDPGWRFISVRRLVLMIMKAVDLSTQWAVFEPNSALTRTKLRLSLLSYLTSLWQQGALAGANLEEAFFVKCDEENNPPEARADGRLLAEVGVAPTYPFEFVVLRVWRTGNELEFAESTISLQSRR